MNELFQLSAPWWVFVLRATAIYALVMVLVRWEYGYAPQTGSDEARLADYLRPRDFLAELT